MNLSLERGTGDKIILREMAHTMDLLKTASELNLDPEQPN